MELIRHTLRNGIPVSEPFDGRFDLSCDILVIGLGTAGALAACAAAKKGAKVIGADESRIPGGCGTSACVWDYYFGTYGGLHQEINAEADRICRTGRYLLTTDGGKRSYSGAVKSLALERKLKEYGAECLYGCVVTWVITDDGKVSGAVLFDGERELAVSAETVIDGAEGAVCRLLGAGFSGGRVSDGRLARFSKTVGILDRGYLLGSWQFCGELGNASAEEEGSRFFRWSSERPALAENYAGRSRLYAVGREIGQREVPCVVTERVYGFNDLLRGEQPEHTLFYSFAPMDNSNPDQWDEDDDFQDWMLICSLHAAGVTAPIPGEALIPKGIRGLLVCGKHIGTGHSLCSSVRMRIDMEKCGEAAGVMAAMMHERGCDALTLLNEHYDSLREVLSSSGCYDRENDRGFCDLNKKDGRLWAHLDLPGNAMELRNALSSTYPSLGLLAVRTGNVPDAAEQLVMWLDAEDVLLRESAAVALGMCGDRRAIPVLREILSRPVTVYTYDHPDRAVHPWLWKTSFNNHIKAICLLGRLGDREALPMLHEIAEHPEHITVTGGDAETVRKNAAAAAASAIRRIGTQMTNTEA